MRHERPEPGRPTPIDAVNAQLLRAKLFAMPLAQRARASLPTVIPDPETRAVIVADMVEILDEGRIERGYADIYDLKRAGYHEDLAASIGPEAAKEMARRVAERGIRQPFDDEPEAA